MAAQAEEADLRALINKAHVPPDDPRFANLRKQQEERRIREAARQANRAPPLPGPPRTSAGYPASGYRQDQSASIQRSQAQRESEREILEAEARYRAVLRPQQGESAAIEEALARARTQRQQDDLTMKAFRERQQNSKLRRSATAPPERKPNKLVQAIGGLISGLDVKARPWEAPSDELLELRRAKEALLTKQTKDAEDVKALEALVGDVRLRGTKDADLAAILKAVIDRKTSAEEARKKLELLKAGGKLEEKKELSLADQEKIALMEHEASRLTIIKLQLAQREEARKELAAMEEKLKTLGLAARIVTEEDELDKLRAAAEDDYGYFHADDSMFGDAQPATHGAAFGMPGLQRSQTMDGRSRKFDVPMFDQPASLEGLFEPTLARTHSYGLSGPSGHGGHFQQPQVDQFGRPIRRPVKIDPWIASYWDDKNKSHQHAPGLGADGEHHPRHIDPRLDPNDPYFDPRFARAHEQRRYEAEKKAHLDRSKMMELEKEKEELRRKEKQIEQMELEERQSKHADKVDLQQREMRRRAAANNADAQQREMRRQAIAKEQLNRQEHDLRTREGIEARKRELAEEEHYLLTLQKAETDASRRAQRVQELQRVQNQLHHVNNLNKLLHEEEERARLAKALQNDPGALIKGLDLQAFRDNPALLDDPLLLEKALQLVNPNVNRGVSPAPSTQRRPPPPRPAAINSEFPPALLADFSMTNHAQQQEYLRRIEDEAMRRRFLQQVVAAADEDRAHDLYERFHHLNYDLDLYMPGQQNTPMGARTPVPDILIDRVRSPPTNQDIGPHIVERFVDDVPLQTQQFAPAAADSSTGRGKGKSKGKGKTSGTANAFPASDGDRTPRPSDVSMSRAMSADSDLPSTAEGVRTTAGHPSGAALEGDALSDGAEEAAAIKRELQEIAEAEARIHEEEAKAARPALEASELAAVQPDSDDTDKDGFFAAQDDVIPVAATPKVPELPLLPPPFIANSPPREPVLSPKGVIVWSPREPVPMPDLGRDQEAKEGPDATSVPATALWGEDVAGAGPPDSAAANEAWSISAPASPRSAVNVASPRSGWGGAVASPKSAWGDAAAAASAPASPRASVVGTPKATGITSPATRSVRSRDGSHSPRIVASPAAAVTEVDLPPVTSPAAASVRSASRINTPKAATASRAATPKATPTTAVDVTLPYTTSESAWIAPQSPAAAEVLKSPSVRSARSAKAPSIAASPVISPVRSAVASPAASVRSAAKSVAPEHQHQPSPRASPNVSLKAASATAESVKAASIAGDSSKKASVRSPSIRAPSEKAASAWGSPVIPAALTPKAASPSKPRSPIASAKHGSTAGSRVVTPAAPVDVWGSPAPSATARSVKGTSKNASPAGDAWGSPAAPAGTALASPRSKVATPAQDAWPSPAKIVSPAASIKSGAWGSSSPLRVASPAPSAGRIPSRVTSPVQAGAWGDAAAAASGSAWGSPRAASVRSAGQGNPGASPAASKASVKASSAAAGSPAFGLLVSPKTAAQPNTDAWGSAEEDHQKTATKGSDPVVVSMAEEPLPQPPVTDQHHAEQMHEHHDEEHPFDVYYAGEPLDPGLEVDMTDHMPTTIQEAYPKSGPEMTPEAIEAHMTRVAYEAGYDALYQFAVQDRGDHYWVQGYMVALHEVEENPNAPTGADFAVSTPAQASLHSPSKQAAVTEGSEAG